MAIGRSVYDETVGCLVDPLHLRPQPYIDAKLAELLHKPAHQIRIKTRQHPFGALEHRDADAGPGSHMGEFGPDVTAADQHHACRQRVELEKSFTRDGVLL